MLYFTIAPFSAYHQPTFQTHPWSFEIDDTLPDDAPFDPSSVGQGPDSRAPEKPILVTGGSRPQRVFYATAPIVENVDIVEAQTVDWSIEAHSQKFGVWAEQVKTLLLCHNRDGNAWNTDYSTRASSNESVHGASDLTVYDSVGSLEQLTDVAASARQKLTTKQKTANWRSSFKRSQVEEISQYCILSEIPKVSWDVYILELIISAHCSANCLFCPSQPVLLIILKMAAPRVWDIYLPLLPAGANPQEYRPEERAYLFAAVS